MSLIGFTIRVIFISIEFQLVIMSFLVKLINVLWH